MKTALLTAGVATFLLAGSLAGTLLFEQASPSTASPTGCRDAPELNFTFMPEAPLVGEPVLFEVAGPVCGDRALLWMVGGVEEPFYGSKLEHAFEAPGAFAVTLILLGSDAARDVTRIVEVAAPPVADAAPADADEPDPALTYVFEPPKYEAVSADLNITTAPLAGTPFAWGLLMHTLHAFFDVEDAGFLVKGLVVFEDYKGIATCGITFPTENFTYEGGGHYQAWEHDCAKRVAGYAERVYIGVCVEYDGYIVPPEEWVTVGDEVHGDKMDECWQEILDTPLPV